MLNLNPNPTKRDQAIINDPTPVKIKVGGVEGWSILLPAHLPDTIRIFVKDVVEVFCGATGRCMTNRNLFLCSETLDEMAAADL